MQFENELEIKVYDKDYGFGRIVLQTIEGAVYLGEDVEDAGELVKDFIRKRMGKQDERRRSVGQRKA